MSDAAWAAARPALLDFNQRVVECWNFAGGWQIESLEKAAVFYEVDDLHLLLWLCLQAREFFDARKESP